MPSPNGYCPIKLRLCIVFYRDFQRYAGTSYASPQLPEVAGNPLVEGPTSPFAFLDLPVVGRAAIHVVHYPSQCTCRRSGCLWRLLLCRCREDSSWADILGGNLDASESLVILRKIGGILENVWVSEGSFDMLKNIPGFSAITDAISGALVPAIPSN